MPDRDITTVKELCAATETPFYELSYGVAHSKINASALKSVEAMDIRMPYVYCGLVE